MVTIPAATGEMGIMAGHESIIAGLKEGKIALYDENQKIIEEFEVEGGFVEIMEDKLLALVDSIHPSNHPFRHN